MTGATEPTVTYKRVLLKISGEALMGDQGYGLTRRPSSASPTKSNRSATWASRSAWSSAAATSSAACKARRRGWSATADYMGMLATVMNALAMQAALEALGVFTRVISAHSDGSGVPSPTSAAAPYAILRRSASASSPPAPATPISPPTRPPTLRANEMGCEAIFKGTKVDGVYDKDPKKHADAKRYDHVTYDEVLQKHLEVMDASAIALARDNNLPIIVFSLDEPGGFRGILSGKGTYTTVKG
jgi:uridylate kinase